MTTFDKREQAFENKLAHEEELKFRAIARRNKMFGLWAADKLGRRGPEAEAYAESVVRIDIAEGGDGVFNKVRADFDAAGVQQSDHQLRRRLDELLASAKADVQVGTRSAG